MLNEISKPQIYIFIINSASVVGAVFILDHPEGVDNLTVLVVGDLLDMQMGCIVGLKTCIAIVLQVKVKKT